VCPLRNLASEGARLLPFVPPFRFTDFFAPEDTLLCLLAAESAAGPPRGARRLRVVELTAGSGLVGLALLRTHPAATLVGIDVDPCALTVARANACALGVGDRSRFVTADLWDAATERLVVVEAPDLLVCNPPYIPEPPGKPGAREAGAGPDGADHLRRVIALVDRARPPTLALSWCSLSDPAGVVAAAERLGYQLLHLDVVAIPDGEYSGQVVEYLRRVPTAYLNDTAATLRAVAPDGAAIFSYLLMAGTFRQAAGSAVRAADMVAHLCAGFAAHGIHALAESASVAEIGMASHGASPTTRYWVLDRWGELALRVALHG